jgi:hypothetical protein
MNGQADPFSLMYPKRHFNIILAIAYIIVCIFVGDYLKVNELDLFGMITTCMLIHFVIHNLIRVHQSRINVVDVYLVDTTLRDMSPGGISVRLVNGYYHPLSSQNTACGYLCRNTGPCTIQPIPLLLCDSEVVDSARKLFKDNRDPISGHEVVIKEKRTCS